MANEPITREEILLNAVATGEAANLEPITREEMFLAKLGGADVTTPTPVTRKEQFLQKAIQGVAGGGGGTGGGDSLAKGIIEGTVKEISDDTVTRIKQYAFNGCGELVSANFPKVTIIGNNAFYYCVSLTTINVPVATEIGFSAFVSTRIDTMVLRNTDKICVLKDANAFNSTPFATHKGYFYVPSALIEEYKVATNWSVFATDFRALEDYTVDGTTTGKLDPSKI